MAMDMAKATVASLSKRWLTWNTERQTGAVSIYFYVLTCCILFLKYYIVM